MRPCPSFSGYSADSDGRVFTHRKGERVGRGGKRSKIVGSYARELKGHISRKGYRLVGVIDNGRKRPVGVHQLVADAFLGPRPSPLHQVRHLDGNPANNCASNLAWGLVAENAADRLRHGRYARGARHPNAKLTEEQAREILALRDQCVRVKVIADRFGVGVSTVEDIIYGKQWRHISFKRVDAKREAA